MRLGASHRLVFALGSQASKAARATGGTGATAAASTLAGSSPLRTHAHWICRWAQRLISLVSICTQAARSSQALRQERWRRWVTTMPRAPIFVISLDHRGDAFPDTTASRTRRPWPPTNRCLGIVGVLIVPGCDGTDIPSDKTRSAEFRKASFGPYESSAALPDDVKVNQERPQEQKLIARVLLDPGHLFEMYQGQSSIYYAESGPAGVQPFPLTEQEKRELTPKSVFKRIAPELPIHYGVELAEVEFQKHMQLGICTEHSDGLIHCPSSHRARPKSEMTEPLFAGGAAPALDGGTSTSQANSDLAGAIGENDQASDVGGRVIRPSVKGYNNGGIYTGCPRDWFRAAKCKDPPWNGTDWSECLANYLWAYASASAHFDGGTVCTVSGAINFEYYENNTLTGSFYTTESNWRSVWGGPRTGCGNNWYCLPLTLWCCGDTWIPIMYNIPTYPNGPVGTFHFTVAFDL